MCGNFANMKQIINAQIRLKYTEKCMKYTETEVVVTQM